MKKKHFFKIKRAFLVLLLPVVTIPFSLISSMLPASAASGTYSSMSLSDQVATYGLYVAVSGSSQLSNSDSSAGVGIGCVVQPTIQNADIQNYHFYVSSLVGPFGYDFSSTGTFDCGSTSSVKSALASLGISNSNPGEILCMLGYKQTEAKSVLTETSCFTGSKTSSNDTFTLSSDDAAYNKAFLAASKSVLGGTAPTFSDAMAYQSTLNDFFKGCGPPVKATGSFSQGLVATLPILDTTSGTMSTQYWTYTNETSSGSLKASVHDIAYSLGGAQDCTALAGVLSKTSATTSTSHPYAKYLTAYQASVYHDICSQQYSTAAQADACVNGHAEDTSNIAYCTTQYTSNTAASDACYTAQGYLGGQQCYAKYTDMASFTACVNGRANSTDPNYCSSVDGQGQPIYQPVAVVAACRFGQNLGPVTPLKPLKTDCSAIPTPANCNTPDPTGTSCAIQSVGWLMCPIITFMAQANDGLYGILSGLLAVDTDIVSTTGKNDAAYIAWGAIRNIANVGLVIAFMIIIFSQITSLGISNYGVKKRLPRLIIAAILINLSFLVCQIAVDVSNIVGGSIGPFFSNLPVFGNANGGDTANIAGQILSGAMGIGLVAAGVGAAVIAGSLLLPVLGAALLAIFVTVLILAARKVIIVLLIVMAPLAFLAMLLPGTEGLFKQWRKILIAMLIIYPEVGLLFAGSTLASKIISGSTTDALNQIIVIIITFVPLLATPALLQGSLKAVPVLGGIASKLASRANSNVSKSANKQLKPELDKYLSRKAAGLKLNGEKRVARQFRGGFKLNKDGTIATDEHGQPIRKRWFGAKGVDETTTTEKEVQNRNADGSFAKGKTKVTDTKTEKVAVDPKRRTFGEMLGQRQMSTQKELEANKLKSEANYGTNSLLNADGTSKNRTGAAALRSADRAQSAKLQQSSVDEVFNARLKDRQRTNGSSEQRFTSLKEDAQASSKLFDAKIKDHQLKRIRDNDSNTAAAAIGIATGSQSSEVLTIGHGKKFQANLGNLGDLSKATFAAEGSASATEKEIEAINERSGVADTATRRTQIATKNIENVHANEKNEFEETLLGGGENASLGAEAMAAQTESTRITAEQNRIRQEAEGGVKAPIGPDGEPLQRGDGSSYFTEEQRLKMIASKRASISDTKAGAWAEGNAELSLQQEIANNPQGDWARRTAGQRVKLVPKKKMVPLMKQGPNGESTNDPEIGSDGRPVLVPEVDADDNYVYSVDAEGNTEYEYGGLENTVARAFQAVQADTEGDAAAIRAQLAREGKNTGDILGGLGVNPRSGEGTPPKDIPIAQEIADIEHIAASGDIGGGVAITEYTASLSRIADEAEEKASGLDDDDQSPNAVNIRKAATDARERSKLVMNAMLKGWQANSKGRPTWWGGSDDADAVRGRASLGPKKGIVNSLALGKSSASAQKLSGANYEQLTPIANTLQEFMGPDGPAKLNESLKESAQKILPQQPGETDDAWQTRLEPQITTLKENFGKALLEFDRAIDDPDLNNGLGPREIQQLNKGREALIFLTDPNTGVLPRPKIKDANGKPITYRQRTAAEYKTGNVAPGGPTTTTETPDNGTV